MHKNSWKIRAFSDIKETDKTCATIILVEIGKMVSQNCRGKAGEEKALERREYEKENKSVVDGNYDAGAFERMRRKRC